MRRDCKLAKKNCNQNDLLYFLTEFVFTEMRIFFSSKRSIFLLMGLYIFFIPYPLRRANIQYTYLLLSDLSHQLLLRTSHTK